MLVLQIYMHRSQPTKEDRVGKHAHRCPQPQSSRSINTHVLPEHGCTRFPTGRRKRQTDASMTHMKREHTKHGKTTHTEASGESNKCRITHCTKHAPRGGTRQWAIHTARTHRTHLKRMKGLERNPKHQDNSTRGLHSIQQRMTVLAEYT